MVTHIDLLNVYKVARECVYRAVDGVQEEQAAWKPAEQVKSIQEIVVHIGGAERFWQKAMGMETLEFPNETTLAAATHFIRNMEATTCSLVMAYSIESFNTPIDTERGKLSPSWMIKRVTQHMFYHLGTLIYLRHVLQPDWEGADEVPWNRAVDAFSDLVPPDAGHCA